MVISVREKNGIAVFDIEGEIRRSEAAEAPLHQLVKGRLDSGARNLLLNFDRVGFIDSYGVGEILAS